MTHDKQTINNEAHMEGGGSGDQVPTGRQAVFITNTWKQHMTRVLPTMRDTNAASVMGERPSRTHLDQEHRQ